ncbi:MAG: hypothetical protein ACYDH9_08140 [Limisphaerales bacterium]
MNLVICFVLGLVIGFIGGFFLEAVRTHNQQATLTRDDLGAIAADVRALHFKLAEQQTQQLARDTIALIKSHDTTSAGAAASPQIVVVPPPAPVLPSNPRIPPDAAAAVISGMPPVSAS